MSGGISTPALEEYAEEAATVIRGNWIVLTVACIGYGLLPFIAEQPYYLLQDATRLLLYAILVQMLTFDIPLDFFIDETLNGATVLFIYVSSGTVLLGRIVEIGLVDLAGELVAAQFLVLAVLGARVFLALRKYGPTFFEDEPNTTKYRVYVPCLTAFLLPFLFREVQRGIWILPRLSIRYPSAEWFVWTIVVSAGVGAGAWWFVEEYHGLRRIRMWAGF